MKRQIKTALGIFVGAVAVVLAVGSGGTGVSPVNAAGVHNATLAGCIVGENC